MSAFESYVRGLLAAGREQQTRYFQQSARLDPGYAPAAFRLAQLYFDGQDYPAAADWFDKVGSESNLALDARFYLSLCRFFLRDPAGAFQTLAPLAERLPVREIWNNLGVFASHTPANQDAPDYFARALADDPGNADVLFNLGLHHFRRAEWRPASEALEQCLQGNPDDSEALFLYASALEFLGRSEEAHRARQQAVGDNPALALSLERRQSELDRLEQRFNARQALLDRQRQEPPEAASRLQHVAVHVQRGEDFLSRGELEPARLEFTEAILLDPDSARAHFLLAEVYRRQGRTPEAISELKASLWSQETLPARLRLAELFLEQNRLEEAQEQVKAALALDPANADARALQARLNAPGHGNGAKPR